MAQSSQALVYVCRSCRQTLNKTTPQIRTFTSTPQRSKTIPSFTPTSSPELDSILFSWRHKVFKPSALAAHHRALIYKKSRHQIIENDPGVTVTMSNDEEIKLEPMDRFDRPNKRQSLTQIAKIMGNSQDAELWANLPAFLEGMTMAGENTPEPWMEKMTRKANETGRAGVIVRCAEMVRKTGMTLSRYAVTRELFLGCHERAAQAGFKGEEMEKAVKVAQQISLMLEDKEHCGGKLKVWQTDMRRDLTVVGVLLELAAAKALNVHGGKDVEGTVGSYATKVLALSEEGIVKIKENPRTESILEDLVPLANGIRLALKMDNIGGKTKDEDMKKKLALKTKLTELDAAIREYSGRVKAEANGKPRRALIMLEKVNGV